MKKITFLFLGILMVAGGLLVSCEKKDCKPERSRCGPCKMEKPDCSPCKKY